MALSYYLSGDILNRICTPERPLSSNGSVTYLSFWKDKIIEAFKNILGGEKEEITLKQLQNATKINASDLLLAMSDMGIAWYDSQSKQIIIDK